MEINVKIDTNQVIHLEGSNAKVVRVQDLERILTKLRETGKAYVEIRDFIHDRSLQHIGTVAETVFGRY